MSEAGDSADGSPDPVRIPPDQLDPKALRGVIEEFVTRDGTELTDMDDKARVVEAQLRRGEVVLWFDPATRTCNILPRDSAS